MKRFNYVLIFMMLISTTLMAQKGRISNEEKAFIQNFLDVTEANLISTVEELDDEKWNYRPAQGGWTTAECMEHVILAEKAVFQQVKSALENAADNSKNLKQQDGWLLAKISDRGVKVTTPLNPKGANMSKSEMIEELQSSRKEIKEFLNQKNLPLRNHFGRSPYGPADAYQLFIVIAAHSMRHNAQINEVLTDLVN